MYQHHCNCNRMMHDCRKEAPCKCEPIVMQPRTCVVNRFYPIEQPIIVPTHTRIINNYVPVPKYYPQFTQSEENCCRGGSHPTEPDTDMETDMGNQRRTY